MTPLSVVSSTAATDFFPVSQLLSSSGLTIGNYLTTDDVGGTSTRSWVTNAPGGFPSDYYANGTQPPELTFFLDDTYTLTDIAVWGYSQGLNNDAKTLELEFSTDGGVTFSGLESLTKPRFTGSSFVHKLPFSQERIANAVRVTIVDNYYGAAGDSGGDRVGLDEVRFIGRVQRTNGRSTPFDRVSGSRIDIGALETTALANPLASRPTVARSATGPLSTMSRWQPHRQLLRSREATLPASRSRERLLGTIPECSVQPNQGVEASVRSLVENSLPSGDFGEAELEFYDISGAFISSEIAITVDDATPEDVWQRTEASATAPPAAVTARIVATYVGSGTQDWVSTTQRRSIRPWWSTPPSMSWTAITLRAISH